MQSPVVNSPCPVIAQSNFFESTSATATILTSGHLPSTILVICALPVLPAPIMTRRIYCC